MSGGGSRYSPGGTMHASQKIGELVRRNSDLANRHVIRTIYCSNRIHKDLFLICVA